ncbi:hypothetical protein [Aquimarina muelleri]|uniref:Uncharacterized protein n=1 Tax=Aquimarina muelleri TaxID=279356 RepID=A0A918JYZ9_9FLAO|nr:hypothetical protein [Aquimarina muelleri]MCX2763678.1 hypothetical protein [Aquimarina muelleri]GGX30277.1 hypothetical protein GCM10007384_34230 [Aquimarina muelleri]
MKENPFKNLETKKEAPKEIKDNIMKEIASIKLFMEFGDLFFIKYPSVIKSYFKSEK